jgi:hypothetical protein
LPVAHSRGVSARRYWPVALLAVLACGDGLADAALRFSLAGVEGDGWRAADVHVELRRDEAGALQAKVAAARLELPPPIGTLEHVAGECRQLLVTTSRFTCGAVRLVPGPGLPGGLEFAGRIEYRRDTGALSWELVAAVEPPATLAFGGALAADRWRVRLRASAWPAGQLARWSAWLGQPLPEVDGALDINVVAQGRGDGLDDLVFELRGAGMSGANETGTIAAEGLGFELRGSAWDDRGALAFDARGTVAAGEAYIEPVYASLAAHPVRFTARGAYHDGRIDLGQLVFEQEGVVHVDAHATLARIGAGEVEGAVAWRVETARLRLAEATLPGAYTVLLQPLLSGTVLGNLDSSGLLRGELEIRDNKPEELWLELAGVSVEDRDNRLAFYELSGDLAWAPAPMGGLATRARPANLRWAGGFLYGIPFGAARVRLDAYGGRWALSAPVSIPVLDGALEINTLEIGDFTIGEDSLLFDARLTPLSMRELSRALDWPPLSGQLSGALPSLSYENGVLTVGGELTAEVFSGELVIRDLRIERLLQPLTRLQADIGFHGFELAELTEVLAFGLMTGRLEGYVRNLEMIDWAPVAFDARLQTPPGDRSRRRISQRAVDNIASIGGGGAGVLSTGFLRFFEDFSYDAFALGCRLERDVCHMSGLEARDQGYVILRGRGLPRIDVMGFAERVSWSALVEQVAGIMESEGPEIR